MKTLWQGVLLALISAVFSCGADEEVKAWPKIQSKTVDIRGIDPKNESIKLFIRDSLNNKAYKLECHSFDSDPGKNDFTYSGIVHCGLWPLFNGGYMGKRHVSSLLEDENETSSKEWHNRGRFLPGHLDPGCADYKNWGSSRTFLLRGMQIVIRLSNISKSSEKDEDGKQIIKRFDFHFSVKPNKLAASEISSPPKELEPYWFYHSSTCK